MRKPIKTRANLPRSNNALTAVELRGVQGGVLERDDELLSAVINRDDQVLEAWRSVRAG